MSNQHLLIILLTFFAIIVGQSVFMFRVEDRLAGKIDEVKSGLSDIQAMLSEHDYDIAYMEGQMSVVTETIVVAGSRSVLNLSSDDG